MTKNTKPTLIGLIRDLGVAEERKQQDEDARAFHKGQVALYDKKIKSATMDIYEIRKALLSRLVEEITPDGIREMLAQYEKENQDENE